LHKARYGESSSATGVRASQIVDDTEPFRSVYEPEHPDADEEGFVDYPNVDPLKEMTDMMGASRSYEANITSLNTTKDMLLKALELRTVTNLNPIQQNNHNVIVSKQPKQSFSNVLKEAINDVSKQENESDVKATLLAESKIDNLHDVMISAQKANIKIETAVEVQQKALDAYNEIMRMQI